MSNNNNNNEEEDFMTQPLAVAVYNHFVGNDCKFGVKVVDICQEVTDAACRQAMSDAGDDDLPEAISTFIGDIHRVYYKSLYNPSDRLIPLRDIDNLEDLNNYIVANSDYLLNQFSDYQCFFWYMFWKGEMLQDPRIRDAINNRFDGIKCLIYMMDVIQREVLKKKLEDSNVVDKVTSFIKNKI
jgi:hypothetical protein